MNWGKTYKDCLVEFLSLVKSQILMQGNMARQYICVRIR